MGLGINNTLLYPGSGGTEIDLRDEMKRLMHGDGTEIPKGRKGLLRRMRKNDNGNLILCECVDDITHEPDLDTFCPYCLGEGYKWDEEIITYYKVVIGTNEGLAAKVQKLIPGELNVPFAFYYIEYFVNPSLQDKLVEIRLDLEGNVITPLDRHKVVRLEAVQDFRSDNGRIEYFRLGTNLEVLK